MSYWKNRWNKRSALKLGWKPEWFGTLNFDNNLLEAIESFQRRFNVKVDGLCGKETYRLIMTEREANKDLVESVSYIICHGDKIPIAWGKVRQHPLPTFTFKKSKKERKPYQAILHWDAALSANSAYKILRKRKYSTHFVIDNDGTIVQMVDTNDIAWHAGKVNKISIGIDFSNAFYTKYQSWYRKRGFGNRPVLNSRVHGRRLGAHLGYYEVQVNALNALLIALHEHYGIELKCPLKDGKLLETVDESIGERKFRGVANHYNVTKKKIDCAGLKLDEILEDLRHEQETNS